MKVTTLKIRNVGMIADTTIELNKPLILFYGEIRQGKSTILNAIRWAFGGTFPKDIIRHGEQEASVELAFDGGLISRSWYRSKSGETKGREIEFVKAGRPVKSPVAEIKQLLNPFLLDQDHLKKMGEAERKAYFTELFAVDTTELDTEAFNCTREAQQLRAKIDGYGDIDLTPVEKVDVEPLKAKFRAIRDEHRMAVNSIAKENEASIGRTAERNSQINRAEALTRDVADLKRRLEAAQDSLSECEKWLQSNPPIELKAAPPEPDTAALEARISNAAAENVRWEQLQRNKQRAAQKENDQKALLKLEARGRDIKKAKIARLAGIAEQSGIKDLAFDELGNFTYQGTHAGMLSTSQVMRLSSELSALYPEGFGLDLIDRGESLGKSIFDFIDRAKAEEKTILATIVGEAPAKVPSEVGVYVVENGNVCGRL